MATLTVPSNLLAAGEYAVLEEGGMGLAIAVDQRVTVTIEQGEGIRIEGSWLGAVQEEFLFPAIDCSSLSYKVIEYLSEDTEIPNAENFTLSIDSSPLFHPEGTKRGYGSSAAVTVGIVAAWLYIALADRPTERVVSQIAIAAHRYAQGGRGSGYDVACSCFGSVGLFKGGGKPHWEEVPLQWTQHIYLFPGPSHVSTPAAIALYEDWKKAHREQAADFIAKSNDSVKSLCNAQTGQELTESLRMCRQIGIDLGNSIGVCAEIAPPHGWIEGIHKAVGAGNELGIFATDTQLHADLIPVDCEEIKVAEEGIRWES